MWQEGFTFYHLLHSRINHWEINNSIIIAAQGRLRQTLLGREISKFLTSLFEIRYSVFDINFLT
jgi:hypothetical protein